MDDIRNEELTGRYEAAFSVFMAVVAFLWRREGDLADPILLALFALLMGVNLAAGRALRRWPALRWLAAAITLSNCGVVAAIVARSGGGESQFWVLYLLPVFSSCLLLGGRETALVSAGALAFNAAGSLRDAGVWGADDWVSLALKSAVLVLAASVTLRLAERERAARARLQQERERVKEKAGLADLGLLGAGLAHDLGGALTVILGYADVALMAQGVPADVQRDLTAIRRSAVLARRLSSGLLGLAKGAEEREALDLGQLVRETLEMARGSMTKARVALNLDLGEASAEARVGRTSLQRLLLNLISNAVRAMADGGELRVKLRQAQGQAVLTIEDNGPGLPPAVAASLFQPFTRGGAAEGHGLGLYLSAEAAQENGGRLRGENRPTGGARFTLTLPLHEPAALIAQS